MKKLTLLLLLVAGAASARSGCYGRYNCEPETIHICRLAPFTDMYIEAGTTEDLARKNTARRCEMSQGQDSIFCRPAEAKCSVSRLVTHERELESRPVIYSENWQRGTHLELDQDIPVLAREGFRDGIASFIIPPGWEVRFYEGENFSGDYHDESRGKKDVASYGKKIRSVKILRR